MPDVAPFSPQAGADAIEDLRARLRATRWPDAPSGAGWSLGADIGYLRELVGYWADGFDWPAQEAALARLPRFRVPLGDLGIHFVHARAVAPAWPPGSSRRCARGATATVTSSGASPRTRSSRTSRSTG